MTRNARARATRNDFVLDVGSGGHPHSSADVLVDRYLEDTLRHRGNRPLVKDRPFVLAMPRRSRSETRASIM